MRLLKDAGVEYRYREYTQEPLSADEIRSTLSLLGVGARSLLRKNDKAYKALDWSGEESDEAIIERMAEHPTLLQRPIAISGKKAVVGRPPARVLELE